MKIKLCTITIMIVFLLGLLLLNSYAAEVVDKPSKKTPEPKEEIIETLKAKNDNEKAVTEKKGMDAKPAQQESKDKKPVETKKVMPKEQIDKEKVYFTKRSHALGKTAKKILNETAVWLKDNPKAKMIIEGHGNEYKNSEKNLILGELRGGSVLSYLVKQGISEERLTIVSYGSERSKNRRVAKTYRVKNWRVCFLVKEMENK